jgi:predicted amidohydrolase
MKEIRVGVWQFEPTPKDPAANLAALAEALESRDARDLDLLVAPEMFLTGWSTDVFRSKDAVDPSLVTKVGHHAKKARVAIAASMLTRSAQGLHNTFHLWGADGKLLGTQHKIHLWGREAEHLKPGQEPTVIEAPFARVGGVICYDVEFPEVARSLALQGAELLLVPAAFWSPTSWDLMTRARALENNCFVAAANQVGGDPNNPHNGQSRIVDPFGNVRAEVPGKTSGIASATLDPTRIPAARNWAPFLRDLRMGPQRALQVKH